MDLKINTATGDLDISNGIVNLINDADAIAQDMRIRLRTFLGEWFLDTRIGIPYFRDVLIKNPNIIVLQSIFRDVIINTPGISGVNDFEFDLDSSTRTLSIQASPVLEDGTTFNFDYEELIIET